MCDGMIVCLCISIMLDTCDFDIRLLGLNDGKNVCMVVGVTFIVR
jgi:hypothetical protein